MRVSAVFRRRSVDAALDEEVRGHMELLARDYDTAGQLSDGTKIDGPAALREALLSHKDAVLISFTERLLMYGVGRRVERTPVLPDCRLHADLIDPAALEAFLRHTAHGLSFDVMLEAKGKDLALLRLREQLRDDLDSSRWQLSRVH